MRTTTYDKLYPLLLKSGDVFILWDKTEGEYGLRYDGRSNFYIVDEDKFAFFVLKYS